MGRSRIAVPSRAYEVTVGFSQPCATHPAADVQGEPPRTGLDWAVSQ